MTAATRRAGYVAAVLGAMVTALLLFGRSWWCGVGDLVPWSWQTDSAHGSQHLIDPYSFTHVEHGLIFFWVLALVARCRPLVWRLLAAITLEASWEVLENSSWVIDRYREQTMDAGYYGDSILNSLSDIACCVAGFLFAARCRWWWTVGLFVSLELGLAFTIRDGLLLNIVMLIYSFDFIRDWQAAR